MVAQARFLGVITEYWLENRISFLFVRSLSFESFAEPSAGFIGLGRFPRWRGYELVPLWSPSINTKAGQFAAMKYSVLAQSGETADYLSVGRLFRLVACTRTMASPSRPGNAFDSPCFLWLSEG